MRDFLCFGGGDRAEEVPYGLLSAVSRHTPRGSRACEGNGVILSFKFKQGSMPSVQGVFGRDRILRTCKVRVPEDCLQPEEIGFE